MKHNTFLAVIATSLIALSVLTMGSGGSGCLGAPPKPYSCKCPVTNQIEHYYGNEDLTAAMKNPSTCCYKALHYVAPEIMLNPKIGDWVQLNGTYYKLVGVSCATFTIDAFGTKGAMTAAGIAAEGCWE